MNAAECQFWKEWVASNTRHHERQKAKVWSTLGQVVRQQTAVRKAQYYRIHGLDPIGFRVKDFVVCGERRGRLRYGRIVHPRVYQGKILIKFIEWDHPIYVPYRHVKLDPEENYAREYNRKTSEELGGRSRGDLG